MQNYATTDEAFDLSLDDLVIEELEISEIPDALQLPETAASCTGSCCVTTCCCTSIAA